VDGSPPRRTPLIDFNGWRLVSGGKSTWKRGHVILPWCHWCHSKLPSSGSDGSPPRRLVRL
jgi:hypothetical protein